MSPRAILLLAAAVLPLTFDAALGAGTALTHDPFRRPDLLSDSVRAADDPPPWQPRLRGVLVAGPRSMANVSGTILHLGQEIDGYRLVRVEEGRAWLRKGGSEVMLKLEHLPETGP